MAHRRAYTGAGELPGSFFMLVQRRGLMYFFSKRTFAWLCLGMASGCTVRLEEAESERENVERGA